MKKSKYDVEHALAMHAHSYVTVPANAIYSNSVLAEYSEITENCHIYLIGLIPRVDMEGLRQEGDVLVFTLKVGGTSHDLKLDIQPGDKLIHDDETWHVLQPSGQRYYLKPEALLALLRKQVGIHFNVQYVGQAYGSDGSRNALDRLRKHETLQKISILGIPPEQQLTLFLLEILPATKVITIFNPRAENRTDGEARIENGIDKLYGTTEQERVTLYEASLIRYFQPKFNKEFKNSFPSTNMKVLRDCYKKDFTAIVAEICFDDIPFQLFSETVAPAPYHIIKHFLHTDEARKSFFA